VYWSVALVTGSIFDNEIPSGDHGNGGFTNKQQQQQLENQIDNNVETKMQQRFVEDTTTSRPYTDKPIEPSPCSMVNSQFGCCWNNKHIATGPNGEGCPVCRNRKHHHCKKWADQCNDKAVRAICPQTCGICQKHKSKQRCEDRPFWKTQCGLYKDMDLCYMPSILKDCPKTCGRC